MIEQTPGVVAESSRLQEALAQVSAVREAMSRLAYYDHTGESGHQIRGNSAEDLAEVQRTKDTLSGFLNELAGSSDTDSAELRQRVQDSIDFLSGVQQGFEYRQQHNLPSLDRQRNKVRSRLSRLRFQDAISLIEHLQQQPDGADLVEQLSAEYHKIQELLEEFSEQGNEFDLDIKTVRNSAHKLLEGSGFLNLTNGDIIQRYEAVQEVRANLDAIQELVELQHQGVHARDAEYFLDITEKNLSRGVADNVGYCISRLDQKLGRSKLFNTEGERVALSEEPIELINQQISVLESRFSDQGVTIDAQQIQDQIDTIQTEINTLEQPEETGRGRQAVTWVVNRVMRPNVEESAKPDKYALLSKKRKLEKLHESVEDAQEVIAAAQEFMLRLSVPDHEQSEAETDVKV